MEAPKSMSFITIIFIAIVIIIIALVIYYFTYYKNQKPTSLLTPTVYSTSGQGVDAIKNVPMMTPDQINDYLGENFTFSYYMTLTNIGGGTPDANGQALAPLLWIVGVGALVVDMIKGNVYMIVISTPYDPSTPYPSTQTILLTGTDAGLFINKWHQITLTITGATVCVYLDGKMQGNCVTLPNVPLASPTGVYFLQGSGPAANVTSLQAYPFVLSASDIATNYKNTSDSSGNPINYTSKTISFSDMGSSIISLFCKTGLCPPTESNDVTFGPFQQINYVYS